MLRYLDASLEALSNENFVFLSGPRQVGKTTVAKDWLRSGGRYFNWDVPADRATLLRANAFDTVSQTERLVLDELHKFPRWKSWVKGLYDKHHAELKAVVTGSARLDVYQRGGDSLLGRYEYLRLHPLTVGELVACSIPAPPKDWLAVTPQRSAKASAEAWMQLSLRSGFPEPFFRDDTLQHRRWSNRRRDLVIREDLRDLSEIRSLALVEQLALLLPSRVGSPLSVNALREELQTAYDTMKNWLDALERLHYCFRISPYSRRIARSLRKEQKLYLWDWSQVEDPGARFENMVASHLLKAIHAWNDLGYGEYDLHYARDLEKNEVDFVVTESRRPIVLIECKRGDTAPSRSLTRLGALLELPMIQLVEAPSIDRKHAQLRIVSAHRYLSALV